METFLIVMTISFFGFMAIVEVCEKITNTLQSKYSNKVKEIEKQIELEKIKRELDET